ncbi:MAG: DHH family phosphoesterase [Candidatus Bathyarchaeota archaeon]|nr:DHH family phosphoesterase [Candidatus Bathyarchaeota archaeon]
MPHDSQAIEAFLADAQKAANVILETVQNDGFIHIFSHLDADGITAAGVIGRALFRLDARFRIRITQWVDEKIIGEIIADKPELVILTDFGSGYLDLINEKIPDFKVVILDHHQAAGTNQNPNITQVNPHMHGMDGATDVSGSGVAYFAARAMDKRNVDSAPIALVGALGDMQDRYDQRKLGSLNALIVEDAVNAKLVSVEKDLTFFGRETRPIHRTLASTTNPFLPGISGEEDKSLAFLSSLNIPLKDGDRWRALRDLTAEEKKRLCSALADYLLSKGLHYEIANLIGHIYILNTEEPWTPLRDAREFAVVLNSTGRMERPSLGIAVCMGDRESGLDEANKALEDYRKSINKYLIWVWEKPERLRELENIYVVNGEDFVSEKIIGTISSILVSGLPNVEKPLIAYANVPGEGLAKLSSRSTALGVNKGINLGVAMRLAAEPLGGKGGGHNIAAGGQVPLDKIDDFVTAVNELVGRQLKGEKLEEDDHKA